MFGLVSLLVLAVVWLYYRQVQLSRRILEIWKFLRDSEEQRVNSLKAENEYLKQQIAAWRSHGDRTVSG